MTDGVVLVVVLHRKIRLTQLWVELSWVVAKIRSSYQKDYNIIETMAEDNGYPARVTHQWSSSGLTIVQGGCVHTVKLYKGIVQRKL